MSLRQSLSSVIRSVLVGSVLSLTLIAAAQDTTAAISGVVKDASGAVVAGAIVTFIDVDRNLEVRKTTTSREGTYNATALSLGNYKVRVQKPGFADETFQGIVLHVNDRLTLNADLRAGTDAQTVTVSAAQQNLNFEDATQAGLINGTQVTELVLSTRVYEQLVALQPGVAYSGGDSIYVGNTNPSGQSNVVNFSVNGARTSGNNWTVDGADNVDRGSNFTLVTYPSVDAIAEFKTLRNQYSAEFGRSASGQINVVTKSGTNDFHGNVYEFDRNDAFAANAVLNKLNTTPNGGTRKTASRPPLRYNDFGGTIGGPVLIPHLYDGRARKTYFFFSQESRRVITYTPVTLSGVPSVAERQGTFSTPVCTSVNFTTGACNTVGTQITQFSRTALAYAKDIFNNLPVPAADGTLLTAPYRNVYNQDQQIGRIDQSIGDKLQLVFRIINDKYPTVEPGGLFTGGGYPGVQTTHTTSDGRIYLGRFTYVASPKLVFDGGYAYSYNDIISDPVGLALNANSPDVAAIVKLPFQSTLARVPALTLTGGTGVTTFGPYRDFGRNHNGFLNVTRTVGTHTLHAGISYNHYNKNENNAGANAGSFGFTNAGQPSSAVAPNTLNYQQSFANFLTGFATSFSQASIDATPNLQVQQFETYFQDDWKVNQRLTLNLGVRYSKFNQPTDSNNQLTTFDPALYNPLNAPTVDKSNAGNLCVPGAACTGGVLPNPTASLINGISINRSDKTFGNSPYGNKIGKSDNLDFAPRIGFAVDVFGNGRTSLRGGYGIAYDSSLFGTYEQSIFQNRPSVFSPVFSNVSFDAPAPLATTPAQVVRATSPNYRTPYNQQWSLAVQQILPKGVNVEVAYVGNHQVHLIGLVDINQAAPGAFATAGLATAITSSNVGLLNQIRPYRGYSAINSVQPIFMGNYNSLQISGRKQFQHNSLIAANYTWSRALTNANADRTGAPQISSQPSAEYGRAAADRTHIFNANAVYGLPFFYQQRGLAGHMLGGWEVSGIFFANSGLPLNVTTGTIDPAGVGVVFGSSASGGRPDRIGDPNSASTQGGFPLPNGIHNRQRWYNPNVFAPVPAGQYRGGNNQRNDINGPGWWRADVGLFRNFRIVENVNLQLRGEAQNVLNHTNPDTISTGGIISSFTPLTAASTAGNVTGFRDKRVIQLGAKLVF